MVRKNAVEVGVHGGSKEKRTINEGLGSISCFHNKRIRRDL
jgi:hypothetical protein